MNEGVPLWAELAPADGAIRTLPPGVSGSYCVAGGAGALVYLWRDVQAPQAGVANTHGAESTLQLVLPHTAAGTAGSIVAARWFDAERGEWLPAAGATVETGNVLSLPVPAFQYHVALRLETNAAS